MNEELKELIIPEVYDLLLEASKDDVVIEGVINKVNSIAEFVNALIVGILYMKERDIEIYSILSSIVESNPEMKDVLNLKNNPGTINPPKES